MSWSALSDHQRSKVIAAENVIWNDYMNVVMTRDDVQSLVSEVCIVHSVLPLQTTFVDNRRQLSLNAGTLSIPAWAMTHLGILHECTHHLVHHLFPSHGAEFVQTYLDVIERHSSPGLAELLATAMDEKGVHRDVATRQNRVRRSTIYASRQEKGVLVELIMDAPPESAVGKIERVYDGHVFISGNAYDLDRGRYLNVIRS